MTEKCLMVVTSNIALQESLRNTMFSSFAFDHFQDGDES